MSVEHYEGKSGSNEGEQPVFRMVGVRTFTCKKLTAMFFRGSKISTQSLELLVH